MRNFEYLAPTQVKAARRLSASTKGSPPCWRAGTDLLSLMKQRVANPQRVVGLRGIRELHGIAKQDGGMRIGAMATIQDLLDSKAAGAYTALMQAAKGITSPQIRAMGTVVGDLLQRPRCWYYRNGHGLLAMHEGKSMVPNGENRYHAILGNKGPAYFVSASSFAPR